MPRVVQHTYDFNVIRIKIKGLFFNWSTLETYLQDSAGTFLLFFFWKKKTRVIIGLNSRYCWLPIKNVPTDISACKLTLSFRTSKSKNSCRLPSIKYPALGVLPICVISHCLLQNDPIFDIRLLTQLNLTVLSSLTNCMPDWFCRLINPWSIHNFSYTRVVLLPELFYTSVVQITWPNQSAW